MRFSNIVAIFAAVAGITSALQTIPSADGSIDAIAARGLLPKKPAPAKASVAKAPAAKPKSGKVNKCNAKQKPRSMRIKARMDEDMLSFEDNTWWVYEGAFLSARKVAAGHSAKVFDLTGCSAVFFFDARGKASVAHVTAGAESTEAKDAATKAKAAGCTASVKVGAMDNAHFLRIEAAIRRVLPSIVVTPQLYKLDTKNSRETHIYTHVVGTTTITHSTASC